MRVIDDTCRYDLPPASSLRQTHTHILRAQLLLLSPNCAPAISCHQASPRAPLPSPSTSGPARSSRLELRPCRLTGHFYFYFCFCLSASLLASSSGRTCSPRQWLAWLDLRPKAAAGAPEHVTGAVGAPADRPMRMEWAHSWRAEANWRPLTSACRG